jgi:hypothetical protein
MSNKCSRAALTLIRLLPPMALACALLAGCGSGSVRVDSTEAYTGQLAAAVTPITGSAGTEAARLQARLVRDLETSDIFASVILLSSVDERNEAELIIEPRLVGSGGSNMQLAVRARRKTTGEVGVNKTYRGSIDAIVADLSRDLRGRYGG